MTVLLKEPIEGFELEAEWRVPADGEWIVPIGLREPPMINRGKWVDTCRLVLTPKKKKYWRLDCCLFEAATNPDRDSSMMKSALAFDEYGNIIWCYEDCLSHKGKWLRLTEHEE